MTARGSAAPARPPSGSTSISWAWPSVPNTPSTVSTTWPLASRPDVHTGGAVCSTRTIWSSGSVQVSKPVPAVRASAQRGLPDTGAGRLTDGEEAREDLQQDLRLAVTAHRAQHGAQAAVGSGHDRRTEGVGRSTPGPYSAG